ncbi:hypothetical protein AB0B10_25915 [Micromonospora arborensis]|uniref:hypothetical protein n=1 Tax=Micromonospora arborensis TaxID=2116518 RepID=UPI003400BD46
MNLIEAEQRLTAQADKASREVEDAKAAGQLADEDLARYERFHHNIKRLFNNGELGRIDPDAGKSAVEAIGRLQEGAQRRKVAATSRAQHAERVRSLVALLQQDMTKHLGIRDRGNAAGGLGERELYQ